MDPIPEERRAFFSFGASWRNSLNSSSNGRHLSDESSKCQAPGVSSSSPAVPEGIDTKEKLKPNSDEKYIIREELLTFGYHQLADHSLEQPSSSGSGSGGQVPAAPFQSPCPGRSARPPESANGPPSISTPTAQFCIGNTLPTVQDLKCSEEGTLR